MTRGEFLYDLRKRLKKLPPEEQAAALAYYEEYLAEAGPEGEAAAIASFGTPAEVASRIISEYAFKDMQAPGKRPGSDLRTMWIVLLGILAAPIALPVAIVLLVVVFCIIISVFSVYLSMFVAAITMAAVGIVGAVASLPLAASDPVAALATCGASLISLALGAALFIGMIALTRVTVRGITWIFAKLLNRKGAQK